MEISLDEAMGNFPLTHNSGLHVRILHRSLGKRKRNHCAPRRWSQRYCDVSFSSARFSFVAMIGPYRMRPRR